MINSFCTLLLLPALLIPATQVNGQLLHAARATVKVDGRIDDVWNRTQTGVANKFVSELTTIPVDQCPTSHFRLLWDAEYLYVLIDVKDKVISVKNGNPWAQDSVEIFLDENFTRAKTASGQQKQFRISALGEVSTGNGAKKSQINAKVVPMTGGYRIEAAIRLPKNVLTPEHKLGIEFQVNNDPGSGQRESVSKWNHPANDAWHSAANYGTLMLVEKMPETSNQNHNSRPKSKNPISVSYPMKRKNSSVPSWAANAIFYQIFPERFRNGDLNNDPTREGLEFPDIIPEAWKVTPWTEQWYQRADWEVELGQDFYEDGVFHRRYGGDLQGVIDKLDYLEELGINAIYFNPVFYARSLHKYDGNSFHHIDPHFGPDPEGDFKAISMETADPNTWRWTAADKLFLKLLKDAKKRNIRVIIDGVFNHTGRDFFAFKDIVKNQEKSPYKNWYIVDSFDDPKTPKNEFKYKGWWGVDTLPEFADNSTQDDLFPAVKEYVFQATARWMDPNQDGDPSDGIDGWRLDVANEVPPKFWRQWNKLVRKINPEAYTVAEIWDNAAEYLADCGFSATMNYHGFAFPAKGFLVDGRMTAKTFATEIHDRLMQHDKPVQYALQNLFDSHDTDRIASMIVNSRYQREYKNESRFDYDVGERASPRHFEKYDVSVPTNEDKRLLKLASLFQMTFVGAPMIYYGTECGMDGADDPDDRMPMIWRDLQYSDRTLGPQGKLKSSQKIEFDEDLFGYYQRLIALRKNSLALRKGTFKVLLTDDTQRVVVFERRYEDEQVLVVINRGDSDATLDLAGKISEPAKLSNLFDSVGEEDVATTPTTTDLSDLVIKRNSGQVWTVKH